MKNEGKLNFNITSKEDLFELGVNQAQIDKLLEEIEKKRAIHLNPTHITFYFLMKRSHPLVSS